MGNGSLEQGSCHDARPLNQLTLISQLPVLTHPTPNELEQKHALFLETGMT
jgi:hypothetical protein